MLDLYKNKRETAYFVYWKCAMVPKYDVITSPYTVVYYNVYNNLYITCNIFSLLFV